MKKNICLLLAGFIFLGGCTPMLISKGDEISKAREAAGLLENLSDRMHQYYHNTDKVLFESSAKNILSLIDMQLSGYSFSGADAYNMDFVLSLNMQTASGNLVGGTTATVWRRNPRNTGGDTLKELYTLGVQTIPSPHIVYKYCRPQSSIGRRVCEALKEDGYEYKE